jgi:hypothetical protein
MKKTLMVLVIISIIFIALSNLTFADFAGCNCSCGVFLKPPCGEESCRRACGGQAPSAPSSAPTYNYEAERQRQEAERQRQLEAERQRQREIEEEQKREEEANALKKAEFEKNKSEALQSMKGITDNELGLKGSPSGDLGLKGINDDKSGLKNAASYDTKNLTKKKDAVKKLTEKEKKQSAPFQKGLRDASQCYESNARVYCLSEPTEEQSKCVELYKMGFNAGMFHQKTLLDSAFYFGKQDKKGSKKNQSFNHPDAKGSCRVKWIESYNRGYFAGKRQ